MSDRIMMKLGDYEFSLATAVYNKLSINQTYRWEPARMGERDPALQFTGVDVMTMQLAGLILTVFPEGGGAATTLSIERRSRQVDRMRAEARKGVPLQLMDQTGKVWGRWVITAINEDQQNFFGDGTPREVSFSMSLKKYGEDSAAAVAASKGGS